MLPANPPVAVGNTHAVFTTSLTATQWQASVGGLLRSCSRTDRQGKQMYCRLYGQCHKPINPGPVGRRLDQIGGGQAIWQSIPEPCGISILTLIQA